MPVNLPEQNKNEESGLRELIEKNIALTEDIQRTVNKVWNHLWWARVLGILKWAIILAPLVAAWIYLPRLIDSVQSNPERIFNSLLAPYLEGLTGQDGGGLKLPSPDQLPEKYRELLK